MNVGGVDDSDDDVYVRSRHRRRRQRQRSVSVASTSTILPYAADADDDYCAIIEDDAEADVLFASEVIDLTKDDSQRLILPHRPNETELDSIVAPCGLTVKPTNCIQISDTYLGELKINFLQVTTIISDSDGRTFIRGIPFTRPGQKPDPPVLVDVEPQRVIRWRTLIITNAPFPAHAADINRYAHSRSLEQKRIAAEKSAHIVCRWAMTIIYSITATNRNKAEEELLEHLRSDDLLDAKYRVSDNKVSELWRGPRQRGGGWKTTPESLKSLDTPISRCPGQTYTLFDSFSGAGGVSRGAQDAGFKIRYAIDKERELYECDTKKYAEKKQRKPVDILHLSPPCQVWSPAHTHDGPNDAANTEALYTCRSLITQCRPRIITLEQTFGITHAKHVNHFWALIRDFTDLGYSVRWSVIRLCTWGSPQDRKRLIMIASAPGEQVPPFPAPTHSEYGGNGTKPFNTVASTLARVRRGDSLHNPEDVQSFHPPRPSWDANTLGRTITTGGANSYHPSGRRDFTLRELACLQGFPKTHEFVGTLTKIRRQIGNAFPPNTVYVLYKHLHDWLLKEDNVDSYVPEDDVMVIDDEDSDISGSESVIFGEARVSPDMDDVVMGQSDDEVIVVGTNADCDDDCFVDST
ncbi:C-5 cytosine methyltransferase DmtA [Beauveria brongniartii RCEF 3172]|uniref:DNA (cytosine-5-)-methyltransferase n=1 Tax=Beauveria brongniartii RCEF 3172 TaxID=1081107 RepID=A0A167BL28_9HYPO|nr:C-5 cytosine methyltransferase DmtA [Beauveria brongniartii RCEF 3172]